MDVCSSGNGDDVHKLVGSMEKKMNAKLNAGNSSNRFFKSNQPGGSHNSAGNCKKCNHLEETDKKELSFATSFFAQFMVLLKRSLRMTLREKMLTHMRVFSHVLVGALVGMLYYNIGNDALKVVKNVGCIFFVILFTMFVAMMPTVSMS